MLICGSGGDLGQMSGRRGALVVRSASDDGDSVASIIKAAATQLTRQLLMLLLRPHPASLAPARDGQMAMAAWPGLAWPGLASLRPPPATIESRLTDWRPPTLFPTRACSCRS